MPGAVDSKTLHEMCPWVGETSDPAIQACHGMSLLNTVWCIDVLQVQKHKVISLFSGVLGLDLAAASCGTHCRATSHISYV